MERLCIIPARSGSKRIPGKNTKLFLGKPIITYVINAALESGLFDEVMVSTDSEEIAELAKKYGAQVPFLRSSQNSNDLATTSDVILEVLKQSASPSAFCCLYPTSVFASVQKIREGFELLRANKYDSVISVVKYGHPIQRAFQLKDLKVVMTDPANSLKRSQDLPSSYYDAGQFYWMNTDAFLRSKQIFNSNTGAVEFGEHEAQDIDNVVDWQLAELKFGLTRK